jgi:hypothetical protein
MTTENKTTEDEGWVGLLYAIGILAAMGWAAIWAFNHYEIRRKDEPPKTVALPHAARPTGMITLTTTKEGFVFQLDADSVRGPRTARLGWETIDRSKDKTADYKDSKTLLQVDCSTTAVRELSVVYYKKDGKVLSSHDTDPKDAKVKYFPPDSNGGAVIAQICAAEFDEAVGKSPAISPSGE